MVLDDRPARIGVHSMGRVARASGWRTLQEASLYFVSLGALDFGVSLRAVRKVQLRCRASVSSRLSLSTDQPTNLLGRSN